MPQPFQSARDLFQLPESYAPLSQFFPNSGEDDAYINQIEERRASPPPMDGMVDPRQMQMLASQGLDPFNTMEMAKKIQADIQSQRLIRSLGDIDFNSKDSNDQIAKQFSRNPLAAGRQDVHNILSLKQLAARNIKESSNDAPAQEAVKKLFQIPLDSEDFPEKYQELIGGMDPEVMGNKLASQHFASARDHAMRIAQAKSLREDKKLAAENEPWQKRIGSASVPRVEKLLDEAQVWADQLDSPLGAYSSIEMNDPEIKDHPLYETSGKLTPYWQAKVDAETPRLSDRLKSKIRRIQGLGLNPNDIARSLGLHPDDMGPLTRTQSTEKVVPTVPKVAPDPTVVVPPPVVPPPEAEESIYSIPAAQTPEQIKAAAQSAAESQMKVASADMQKAIEESIVSTYKKNGKSITDAAHDLDRLANDSTPAFGTTPTERNLNAVSEFLSRRGLPDDPNTRNALNAILDKRKGVLSRGSPSASPAAASPVKYVRDAQGRMIMSN